MPPTPLIGIFVLYRRRKVNEKTLLIIKPDAMPYASEIIKRVTRLGLSIKEEMSIVATVDQCSQHYNKDEQWCIKYGQKKIDQGLVRDSNLTALGAGREILDQMYSYMMSGSILVMVVEGINAIAALRKALGGPEESIEPLSAPAGTIRGDFGTDSFGSANGENRAIWNVAHCSDGRKEANREISIWFPCRDDLLN